MAQTDATETKSDSLISLPLSKRMMKAIHSSHEWGNKVRMLKLPLILTDTKLYAGAIANFYHLTKTLEQRLVEEQFKDNDMIQSILALDLHDTASRYECDLKQLYGSDDWKEATDAVKTSATEKYCEIINKATAVQLVSAAFILYGALVIGGGKSTQRKVRKVFPSCDHVLFDVSTNMARIRREFRACFNGLGEKYPELQDEFVAEAKKFMDLNNTVVLSIRCLPFWWKKAALGAVGVMAAVSYLWMTYK